MRHIFFAAGATLATITAALALPLGTSSAVAAEPSCADAEGVGYVCDINNPEDLLRVDGTPYVLTSNMGNPQRERGGFYSVDVRDRDVQEIRPDFTAPPVSQYQGCPGPPDAELFSSHGIDLTDESPGVEEGKGRTVYAVNHGGRESIEVFRLKPGSSGLRLTWIGCVLLPEHYASNSVAALPAGGFVTTVPLRSEAELPAAGLGLPTGVVLRWSPMDGWHEVPGVEVSYPNGIEVSPDGGWLYVAGYTERAVAKVSLGRDPAATSKVAVPFNPDNLRWAPGGAILVTGQDSQPAVVELTCLRTSVETCEVPTGVAKIDPTTFTATSLYRHPGDERFGAGTSSIVVGDELWIGSFRAQRLLRVPLRALDGNLGETL